MPVPANWTGLELLFLQRPGDGRKLSVFLSFSGVADRLAVDRWVGERVKRDVNSKVIDDDRSCGRESEPVRNVSYLIHGMGREVALRIREAGERRISVGAVRVGKA